MGKRFLVTGGSVAANTLAWWLVEGGFTVTVVEKAPAFREGGQSIDVRGAGRTVLDRMGVREEVERNGTGETGWTFPVWVNNRHLPGRKPGWSASGARPASTSST